MDIYHLRYFLAVADRLNFTRAAEDLSIATSPLSRRIRDLERRIGADLFERTPRQVHLTPAGRALLEPAREIVSRFDQLRGLVMQGTQREIKVGISTTTPPELAESVEALLVRDFPQCEIVTECDSYAAVDRHLQAGDLDLAFLYGSSPVGEGDHVDGLPLRTFHYGMLMRADDPSASRDGVTLSAFAGQPFALLSDAPQSVERTLMKVLADAGVRDVLRVKDIVRLAYEVAHGNRYSLSVLESDTPVRKVFSAFRLSTYPAMDIDEVHYTWIAWRRDRVANDAFLASVVRSLSCSVTGIGLAVANGSVQPSVEALTEHVGSTDLVPG